MAFLKGLEQYSMTGEVWKLVDKYQDYAVSSHGRVASLLRNVPNMLSKSQSKGYLSVRLSRPGINGYQFSRKFTVHHLVAHAFLEEPFMSSYVIHHKDGDKTNNNVENLKWISQSANSRHGNNLKSYQKGGMSYPGIRSSRASFRNEDAVRNVLEMRKCGMKGVQIARKMNVGKSVIYRILSGRAYTEITGLKYF